MTLLNIASVEFARRHVDAYWDSDFFPKAFEFLALWPHWGEVREYLTSMPIDSLEVILPRVMAAPKPGGSYRIVHQLDPLNTLAYTAMAFMVAENVENSRPRRADRIACSYRISLAADQGRFFDVAHGYTDFVSRSRQLSARFEHVLEADITDFYNQINLHRLQNNLAGCGVEDVLAKAIERFLMRLNDGISHGIPVGPVASIIMAEATLLDIDEFITSNGFIHTRYVDDFRIFSDSRIELIRLHQKLTHYLYATHRLVLASAKTGIVPTQLFLETVLDDPEETERREIHQALEAVEIGQYQMDEPEGTGEEATAAAQRPRVYVALMERVCAMRPLDLGLARHILRRARRYRLKAIIPLLLDRLPHFAPVINDVVIYLSAIMSQRFVDEYGDRLLELLESSELAHEEFVQFWLIHLVCRNPLLLRHMGLKSFIVRSGHVEHQGHCALQLRDAAWARRLRARINTYGRWEQRQVLRASLALSRDERRHWYENLAANSPVRLDAWLLSWLRSQ